MSLELCSCDSPFPPCMPMPPQGIECDNCGQWLTLERATEGVASLFGRMGFKVVVNDEHHQIHATPREATDDSD